MHSTYNSWLVALSLVVAILASYTALDLAGHISKLGRSRLRHIWLAGGATAMGIGIWSMHFIGMLAFSLPIPLGYDLVTTGYSLVIAILLSYFVLYIVTQGKLTLLRLIAGGTLMGIGIAGMHYTGMDALNMHPDIRYDPTLFVISIVIAVTASKVALWLAYTLKDANQSHLIAKRVGAATVMGIAITGMHYTGMAAAHFPLGSVSSAAEGIDPQWLATTILLLTFAILILKLMLTRFSVTQLNGQIVRLATFDTLTDLPNRWTLTEQIKRDIQPPQKYICSPVHGSRRVQGHQ